MPISMSSIRNAFFNRSNAISLNETAVRRMATVGTNFGTSAPATVQSSVPSAVTKSNPISLKDFDFANNNNSVRGLGRAARLNFFQFNGNFDIEWTNVNRQTQFYFDSYSGFSGEAFAICILYDGTNPSTTTPNANYSEGSFNTVSITFTWQGTTDPNNFANNFLGIVDVP